MRIGGFAQNCGMHLGYFWCLSELNELLGWEDGPEAMEECASHGLQFETIDGVSYIRFDYSLLQE